ncbi:MULTISPECIES: hypothetical protein [Aquimarina]|uniref:hypothetical protein n=1 Tax=Aquimarina TaxID=290174 RepID=UPI000401AE64|nr:MULTISPECIES: hypothetical protein [Aquimarina]
MDVIIMNDDTVEFSKVGLLTLIPPIPKTTIKASGKTTINGKKVCVQGDEKKVEITCQYTVPPFSTPGSGTLKIMNLAPNQLTRKATSGNKKIILKGKLFIALFEVDSPATLPSPPNTPDPVPMYVGTGKLIPGNKKIKAT